MKLKILIPLIIIELLFMSFIGYKILHKTNSKNVLQENITVLNHEDYIKEKIDGLQYFYEIKPNTRQTVNRSVLTRLNYKNNENIVYTISPAGFNQLKDFPQKKSPNIFRIITLGDSFTFGSFVNTKDNYPSQLQQLLNTKCSQQKQFQVINLGVAGYDFQYAVERYKLRGQQYNPDLVLWLVIQSDFRRLREIQTPELKKIDDEIRKTGGDKVLGNEDYFNLSWSTANNAVFKKLGGDNVILQMQYKYLTDINQFYRNELVFVQLPMVNKYADVLSQIKSSRPQTHIITDTPNIQTIKNAQLPDGHPSALGQKLITQSIFMYLSKHNLIPCH